MRKSFLSLLTLLLSSNVLAQPKETPSGSDLKVGLVLPLTGPLGEYGQAFNNGVKLATEQSSAVKQNCNFIVEDSKYDSNTAVSAFQKLTSSEKVPVVYNWGGPTSEALAPLASRANVALFVWSADPRVAEKKDHVIRFTNSGADYGGTLARFLSTKNFKKIGIIKTDNQYIEAILDGYLAAVPDKGSVQVVDSYQPSDQDFRATITKLRTKKFDALGVFLLSGQVSQFVNQLRTQNMDLPIFGTDFFESMTEVRQSHGGMVGGVFANNEVTVDFKKAYVGEFGNDLQINHAANGYDFATFLCEKIKPTLKEFSANEILLHAAATKSFESKQGLAEFTVSSSGDRYFKFPVVIRRIKENEIVTEDFK